MSAMQSDPRYWAQSARKSELPVSQGQRRTTDSQGKPIKIRGDAAAARRKAKREYRKIYQSGFGPGFRAWLSQRGEQVAA